jgi:hypothetical protein
MNVLILTPDAVGSTLLQRLITIYMQFHDFDRPAINLHELTNGLRKYYSTTFNQEVLGKPQNQHWGYYQTLQQIVEMLSSVDHYKTSRLAHYHIKNRQDSQSDQVQFYRYLNENFYIIACRRHNVFEHAVSMALNKITKTRNVYSAEEKVKSFVELYQQGIEIDTDNFVYALDSYKEYLDWSKNYFDVASHFYYEKTLPDIENYILDLPIFAGKNKKVTWHDQFGIEFNNWNRCHYYNSDIGTAALTHPEEFAKLSMHSSVESASSSTSLTLQSVRSLITPDQTDFLSRHQDQYQSTNGQLKEMCDQGIMVSPPPIKKQTLAEKRYLIRNFDQCLDMYNQWIIYNPDVGIPLELSTMARLSTVERQYWKPQILGNFSSVTGLLSDQPPSEQ